MRRWHPRISCTAHRPVGATSRGRASRALCARHRTRPKLAPQCESPSAYAAGSSAWASGPGSGQRVGRASPTSSHRRVDTVDLVAPDRRPPCWPPRGCAWLRAPSRARGHSRRGGLEARVDLGRASSATSRGLAALGRRARPSSGGARRGRSGPWPAGAAASAIWPGCSRRSGRSCTNRAMSTPWTWPRRRPRWRGSERWTLAGLGPVLVFDPGPIAASDRRILDVVLARTGARPRAWPSGRLR